MALKQHTQNLDPVGECLQWIHLGLVVSAAFDGIPWGKFNKATEVCQTEGSTNLSSAWLDHTKPKLDKVDRVCPHVLTHLVTNAAILRCYLPTTTNTMTCCIGTAARLSICQPANRPGNRGYSIWGMILKFRTPPLQEASSYIIRLLVGTAGPCRAFRNLK
jgi:hypothetical protein